ncbi:hypothetical protein LUW77_24185 [Streptomyces radiopugnans]|nr:hypothetical protein LUW77_24185 [Streptomyces radiopugnans]
MDTAVDDRVRAAFTAALVPTEMPGQKPTISFTRIARDGGSLAERVTAALKAKGWITPTLGTALVRMALEGALANAWNKGHVRFGDLWSWYTQYPYLKRLPNRQVLEQAVLGAAGVLLWQQDAFALADGYDEATGEYRNLWIHGDRPEPALVTDDTLLVQPARAVAQRARDVAAQPPAPPAAQAEGGSEAGAGGQGAGAGSAGAGTAGAAQGAGPRPPQPPAKAIMHRFWGVKTLDSNRPAADFANIQQEVLAHLEAAEGVQLEVRIEINATTAEGFTEQQVRTVRENATQLKFEDSGFEER